MSAEPLPSEQLEEIRARHQAATSGHWYLNRGSYDDPNFVVAEHHGYARGIASMDFGVGDEASADREFVLNAHSDMAALLAEVKRLTARVAELEPPTGVCGHESPHGRRCDLQASHLGHHQMTGDNSATHSWMRS
jgi:hypothetical protein